MLDVISKDFKNYEVSSKAIFSKCFKFRYSITNTFNSGKGKLLFILLSFAENNIRGRTNKIFSSLSQQDNIPQIANIKIQK